ncbi:MAG: HlyD family secretion protein [Bacteroidales bacterium]|nr:HlyD family secretion protein [Bacteroidales bacterium]
MKQKKKKLIYNVAVGALVLVAIVWVCARFVHIGNVEFTDNAQVKQQIVPVNSRVQGFIKKIYFEEYQKVKKGDTLVLLEDTEYRFRLAQAEADFQNATSGKSAMKTSITTTQNNMAVSDAGIQEAKIRMENAGREFLRYKNLYEQDAVTKQQYDAMKTEYEASQARYELLVRQKQTTALVKEEQTQRLDQTTAGIKLAQAAVDLAKLNLSYTVIVAPCSGVVGRKNIQEGQLIQPGQTLVDVVDMQEIWVIANYKETQTANIAEGLPVDIMVDAVPDVVFHGEVQSISRATGASFSMIPQDNSAGNFVKVEQRIPVRIAFTSDNDTEQMRRLRAGMNVECEVIYKQKKK